MAINRIWQSGLELGNSEEFDSFQGLAWSTSTVRTGARSISLPNSGSSLKYGQVNVPPTRQVRFGVSHYGLYSGPAHPYLSLVKSDGVTRLIEIIFYNNQDVVIAVAGVEKDRELSILSNSWMHLAVDVKIDSSAGWVNVYKDGVLIMSFSGNTGNDDIYYWRIGKFVSTDSGPAFFDDLYIDDTTGESAAAPPILRFYYTTPNADGNYSQWDGSDGNQVNNYLLVDEIPPNSDTDYVETNVADEYDSYNMTTITLEAGQQVEAVIPIAFCKRTGSTELIALGTRLSGTDAIGSDKTPGTSYDTKWERQTTKPGGGAWGQSDINAFEVLVKSRGTY